MKIKTFGEFPELDTERLHLRHVRRSDAQEVFEMRSDERVQKYLGRPIATSIDDAHAHIEKIIRGTGNNEWINWTITLKGNDRAIGNIGFWNYHESKPEAEIGYELHPNFQGKGIMTEAAAAVLEFGKQEMGLETITAWLHGENEKSLNLLRRFHFVHDPSFVDEKEPEMVLWALDCR